MDNFNFQDNDGWITLSQPLIKNDASKIDDATDIEDNIEIKASKMTRNIKNPILTAQLFICLIVLIIFFVISSVFPNVFNVIKAWYDTEISSVMIFDGDFKDFDYSALFAATLDEAKQNNGQV